MVGVCLTNAGMGLVNRIYRVAGRTIAGAVINPPAGVNNNSGANVISGAVGGVALRT
jgi:hypothetical protein